MYICLHIIFKIFAQANGHGRIIKEQCFDSILYNQAQFPSSFFIFNVHFVFASFTYWYHPSLPPLSVMASQKPSKFISISLLLFHICIYDVLLERRKREQSEQEPPPNAPKKPRKDNAIGAPVLPGGYDVMSLFMKKKDEHAAPSASQAGGSGSRGRAVSRSSAQEESNRGFRKGSGSKAAKGKGKERDLATFPLDEVRYPPLLLESDRLY